MSEDLKVNLVAAFGVVAFLSGVYVLAGLGCLLLVAGACAIAYSWLAGKG